MIMNRKIRTAAVLAVLLAGMLVAIGPSYAEQRRTNSENKLGGAYAASGQLPGAGYTAMLYDASNGLPTSDANYVMCSSDGFIWIGGYSGIIRYDGRNFQRLETSDGLTSGRAVFEDSQNRIWAGTNDNGVVILDGDKRTHITYKEGLPSSSIRTFAEDSEGNVYIGSTAGVTYMDAGMKIHNIDDDRISEERIVRLKADVTGTVFGLTKDGAVFSLANGEIDKLYTSEDLGTGFITSMLTDPQKPGVLYLGTENGRVYHGKLGKKAGDLKKMKARRIGSIGWMCYTAGRLWVSSMSSIGYFSLSGDFTEVRDIPVNSGIEMITSDYQGNIWLASSAQGVMKIVANSFTDLTGEAGIETGVVNATCLYKDLLYIGTDNGLIALKGSRDRVEDDLTRYIGDARVRCVATDNKGSLWVAAYTGELGLVRMSRSGEIRSFTTEDGMPSNEVRCVAPQKDGTVLVGTNAGIAVIEGDKIIRTPAKDKDLPETVVLTVCGNDDGDIYIGTDGDGMYVVTESGVRHLGRDDGLTSDVIMRIRWDRTNETYWLVTSNSIEYLKDGIIREVTSFPYNNNYDLYFSDMFDMWILSSYGVFSMKIQDMLADKVSDFRLYTLANGLTTTPTSNAYSALTDRGNLYIAGRSGVSLVNLNDFSDDTVHIKLAVRSVAMGDNEILPDEDGTYVIPADSGRLKIVPAVLDYTLSNPMVRVYLEDSGDNGITSYLSDLTDLEFTGLSYGAHLLHIQILDNSGENVVQEETFTIDKQPQLLEMPIVRIIIFMLVLIAAAFIIWSVLKRTVIRRQYLELQEAKKDAEKAKRAKAVFLTNMSQEIRNPIYTIIGMNELILREDTRDVPKQYLKTVTRFASDIKNASGALLGLVNEILDLTSIESGKMELDEQEYDTAENLRSVVSMIRIRAMDKDLAFTADIDKAMPSRLYGDPEKIRQILLNLLSNAVKYTHEGEVTLTARVEEKTGDKCALRFSVRDTGIGVRKEDLDKIFTAYERLEEDEGAAIKGTGVGLDVSRNFAELMGGRLWCESEYGKGSEFIFTVEQKIVDGAEIGELGELGEDEAPGSYVPQFVAPDAEILVVDDNPMNLSIIKGLLKATMIFVTTAVSGQDCLEKLKFSSFDLVFLDVIMPEMDGFETVARIREKYPDVPVYAMTAEPVDDESYYTSKGFTGYVSKPVESDELEKAIMKHLSDEIMERRR